MKLIVMLRDPVDRDYSRCNMNVQHGREKRDFESRNPKDHKPLISLN